MNRLLENYIRLREKVDSLCDGITTKLGDAITCCPGCSTCCLSISVFPVEAAAISEAISSLSQEKRILIQKQASEPSDACPLLCNGLCVVYESRPIICRTHGLPIILDEGGTRRIDVCPMNCGKMESLPGEAVIDLERLNTMLAAINALYLRESGQNVTKRISIVELCS